MIDQGPTYAENSQDNNTGDYPGYITNHNDNIYHDLTVPYNGVEEQTKYQDVGHKIGTYHNVYLVIC